MAERVDCMVDIENMLMMLDSMLDTARKRHIVGGALISLSMLFTGLAVTVMTIKGENNDEE